MSAVPSAVSRIANAAVGGRRRRHHEVGQRVVDGQRVVTVWPYTHHRGDLANLSKIRRALVARGYVVDTIPVPAGATLGGLFKPGAMLMVTR